jgi:hypothetical protein
MHRPRSRRDVLRQAAALAAALALPRAAGAIANRAPDRLTAWTGALRSEGLTGATPLGRSAVRVGELAAGSPYEASMLEAYLRGGGSPRETEPLALSLDRFDCVTLVEACLAVARTAGYGGAPSWKVYGREVERMRYRDGRRRAYASRLHYFSEWISNGEQRGLLRDLGTELGGVVDARPLRFMTGHRQSYPALADDRVFEVMTAIERRLDRNPRRIVTPARIPAVADAIATGDVIAFATSIPGLDVTHAAFAYRDVSGVLRVLHAPLSGGVVEVTRATLPEYVAAIRRCTGILVARPLRV